MTCLSFFNPEDQESDSVSSPAIGRVSLYLDEITFYLTIFSGRPSVPPPIGTNFFDGHTSIKKLSKLWIKFPNF
jgi:hypothetical protein